MEATRDDVLAVVSRLPLSIGDVGIAVAGRQGHDPAAAQGQPVGQWLAGVGLSLSALQKLVDAMVRGGDLVEVRGAQLWDLELRTAGTRARGRYYLAPA
jgi:hypothetical protein